MKRIVILALAVALVRPEWVLITLGAVGMWTALDWMAQRFHAKRHQQPARGH